MTSAREAALELLAGDERSPSLAGHLPIQVWTATPGGEVDFVTERTAAALGVDASQLLCQGWQRVVHPDDLTVTAERWTRALATGEPCEVELRLKLADGRYAWHLARAVPQRSADGVVVRWCGTSTEIHDLREQLRAPLVDEARAARQAAEQASQSMDALLSHFAHELRTPLNAMLGWARLLRGGQMAEPARTKALATIERNALAQVQLIEDMLDVSRILSGTAGVELGPVDLVAVVQQAADVARPAATAKGVELLVSSEGPAAPHLGDASRLQQVARNLLSNAVEVTPDGGHVEASVTQGAAGVELAVSDDGEGMTPEALAHAFDGFGPEGRASSPRSKGALGFGLAVVKRLVELHGGHVSACSDGPGLGSTFRVHLPRATPTVADEASHQPIETNELVATVASLAGRRSERE